MKCQCQDMGGCTLEVDEQSPHKTLCSYCDRNCTQPSLTIEKEVNPKDSLGVKKPRLSYVPPSSLIYQALAMQDGAEKYGPYNWREKKVIASIYIDAALRHINQWLDGEENADDSNKPHLGHALACLGIIVDALETGNLIDDRPKPGSASKLIKAFTKS